MTQDFTDAQEEIFSRLFEQAEIAHFTKRERMEYEESLKAYRDWYSVTKTSFDKGVAEGLQKGIEQGREEGIQQGREEGIQQGREEGIQQGREEGLLLVAKRLKTKGLSLKEIAKITSLPLPKLESL